MTSARYCSRDGMTYEPWDMVTDQNSRSAGVIVTGGMRSTLGSALKAFADGRRLTAHAMSMSPQSAAACRATCIIIAGVFSERVNALALCPHLALGLERDEHSVVIVSCETVETCMPSGFWHLVSRRTQ